MKVSCIQSTTTRAVRSTGSRKSNVYGLANGNALRAHIGRRPSLPFASPLVVRAAEIVEDEEDETPGVPPPYGEDFKEGFLAPGAYEVPKAQSITIPFGSRDLTLSTGEIGRQAAGAIWAQEGESVIFTTACCGDATGDGSMVPFQVNYAERFSAAGRTQSGYLKRDGRPKDQEVLKSRLIDRPLRPTLLDGWQFDTQVLSWVLSYDGVTSPEPLAITAAGAALALSDIPQKNVVAGVRVGLLEGGAGFVVNPSVEQMALSKLDLVVAGTKDAVLMIEGYGDFLTEDQMLEAVALGHETIKSVCTSVEQWAAKVGKPKRTDGYQPPAALEPQVRALVEGELREVYQLPLTKHDRAVRIGALKQRCLEALAGEGEGRFKDFEVGYAFKKVDSSVFRRLVLDNGIRADGRGPTAIRPITTRCNVLPRTHGSALFTRGETQAVAVATLGPASAAQRAESINQPEGEDAQRFYLQYFFPPSSVGETGRVGGPGRRELGHGTLAERALVPVVPAGDQFPYVIRVESTITESNGSSSMASVCGGCLAMMDAGVPVKEPVAGIAMGLILEPNGEFTVLSDILGSEDALGDMDFKVAGGESGVTAFQMDIKVEGITLPIMKQALQQARDGRKHILTAMMKSDTPPRIGLGPYTPKIERIPVDPSKIGLVIGPSGKTIKAIRASSGAEADVVEDKFVEISSADPKKLARAREMILSIVDEPKPGSIYRQKRVAAVNTFGVFVEYAMGKQGLVHVSELDNERGASLGNWKEGDLMDVMLLELLENGKVRLSRKAVMGRDATGDSELEGQMPAPRETVPGDRPPRGHRPPRGDRPPRGPPRGPRDRSN